jgi:segregation and condensation protein A
MTHTVAVGEFEGPLGILLELVERGKLEVSSISVAQITAQYLERIKSMEHRSPEDLTEFAQLGARLLYIKSLALLPQESAHEQSDELRLLNLELAEYQRMQEAARELSLRAANPSFARQVTERLDPADLPLPQIALPDLGAAFANAMARLEPVRPTGSIRPHLSLEAVVSRLQHRLQTGGSFELQSLLDSIHDRLEVIVTFLALLELIRSGSANVIQANQFAPIRVEEAHA